MLIWPNEAELFQTMYQFSSIFLSSYRQTRVALIQFDHIGAKGCFLLRGYRAANGSCFVLRGPTVQTRWTIRLRGKERKRKKKKLEKMGKSGFLDSFSSKK